MTNENNEKVFTTISKPPTNNVLLKSYVNAFPKNNEKAFTTTVVNVRTDEYDVYIGRANRSRALAQSIFANPYPIGKDYNREQCLELYEKYIRYMLAETEYFKDKLLTLKGKRLGCWCTPLACHGDVLVKILGEMEE